METQQRNLTSAIRILFNIVSGTTDLTIYQQLTALRERMYGKLRFKPERSASISSEEGIPYFCAYKESFFVIT